MRWIRLLLSEIMGGGMVGVTGGWMGRGGPG